MTAPAATSAGAPFDHVVGGGQNNPPSTAPVAHFQINAKSGPNGEDPEGFFSFKRTVDGPPTEEFTAEVTCLNVQGNLATVVGHVQRTKDDTFPADRYYLVRIKDMGQGKNTEDRVGNSLYLGDPTKCPSPIEPRAEVVTSGNVDVFDAN